MHTIIEKGARAVEKTRPYLERLSDEETRSHVRGAAKTVQSIRSNSKLRRDLGKLVDELAGAKTHVAHADRRRWPFVLALVAAAAAGAAAWLYRSNELGSASSSSRSSEASRNGAVS